MSMFHIYFKESLSTRYTQMTLQKEAKVMNMSMKISWRRAPEDKIIEVTVIVEGTDQIEIEDEERTDQLKVARMATKHVDLQKLKGFAETLCRACFLVGD